MAQMQQQLEASIARAVQDSLATFKQVKTEMVELENRRCLKTPSDNRRDNVKIFDLKMDEGKARDEYNEIIDKVLEVNDQVDAAILSKSNPIIVKFNRMVVKLELLKKRSWQRWMT